jgi:hypothetical protein
MAKNTPMSLRDLFREAERQRIRAYLKAQRCFAIDHLGDGVVLWECKNGHQFQRKERKGNERNVESLWSKAGVGAPIACPECFKKMCEQIDAGEAH